MTWRASKQTGEDEYIQLKIDLEQVDVSIDVRTRRGKVVVGNEAMCLRILYCQFVILEQNVG